MNVLIIVPHPDDEILGFGGAIQWHVSRGDKVFVEFVTDNIEEELTRKQYAQFPEVGKKIGYTGNLYAAPFDDKNVRDTTKHLESRINLIKPEVLYSVFGEDNHQDHRYIFDLIRVASRTWAKHHIKNIYLGEILSSTDQSPKLPQCAFIPTYYIPLTKEEVKNKVDALLMYDDEIQKWPHPRSEKGIWNLAEKRGSECHNEYAESFVTLRHIESR